MPRQHIWMLKMKKLTLLAILVLAGLGIAHIPEIEIIKTAPPEVRVNEILHVDMVIKSNLNETINVELRERVVFGEPIDKENLVGYQNITQTENETIIQRGNETTRWLTPDGKCEVGCEPDGICDPDCGCTSMEDPDCAAFLGPVYYRWTFPLKPDSRKTIGYRINATQIGKFKIPPTKATVWTCPFASVKIKGSNIGEFYSNTLTILVKCNGNGVCEIDKGEYYKNCPEDCKSGSPDGYCDKVIDGRCDPDCKPREDPDCIKAVCGDGTCESIKGEDYTNCPQDCPKPVVCGDDICGVNENHLNCPEDCPSGGGDDYCDALEDGRCDPDCRVDVDPDCPKIFGNGVCEPGFGENYLTCPKDCPSGSRDGYCDKIADGRCDPDCGPGEDQDCIAGFSFNTLAIPAIIIIAAILIYLKFRRKEE